MKLGIVKAKIDIIIGNNLCFKEGELYPIMKTKTKIKTQNELGKAHVIADCSNVDYVLKDGYFTNHFEVIKL